MRPLPRVGRLRGPAPGQVAIDQPRDGPDPRAVAAAAVAVGLGQRVVGAQAPDGVLDGHAAAGERAVVGDIGGRGWPRGWRRGVAPRRAGWASAMPM